MPEKKYLAIGDIHGCLQSLNALLEKCQQYNDRTFIFVGDYIDRGPDSKGVIDRLITFKDEQDCIFLRGNHEQMLLDAYFYHKLDMWLMNGGRSTLASYGATYQEFEFPDGHLNFYESTKMYYDTPNYFFVHAGISPHKTIKENLESEEEIQDFLWKRSHLNAFDTPWEKPIVFGHTPRFHPIRKPQMIGIDTGCVYDKLGYGKLTAMLLPEGTFEQQICIDN